MNLIITILVSSFQGLPIMKAFTAGLAALTALLGTDGLTATCTQSNIKYDMHGMATQYSYPTIPYTTQYESPICLYKTKPVKYGCCNDSKVKYCNQYYVGPELNNIERSNRNIVDYQKKWVTPICRLLAHSSVPPTHVIMSTIESFNSGPTPELLNINANDSINTSDPDTISSSSTTNSSSKLITTATDGENQNKGSVLVTMVCLILNRIGKFMHLY